MSHKSLFDMAHEASEQGYGDFDACAMIIVRDSSAKVNLCVDCGSVEGVSPATIRLAATLENLLHTKLRRSAAILALMKAEGAIRTETREAPDEETEAELDDEDKAEIECMLREALGKD